MSSGLGLITHNWKLKLLAMVLAVLLWVVVSADQEVSQWVEVPVEVVNRDVQHVTASGPIPEVVEVRFSGPRRDFAQLLFDRPRLRLVIDDVTAESVEYPLSPRMIDRPAGLTLSALDIRPGSVRMAFHRLESRDVPVELRLDPRISEDLALREVRVRPATIQISGPARRLEEIDGIPTEPLFVEAEDTLFVQMLDLDLEILEGLRFSAAQVEVSGRVQPVDERTVSGVSVVGTPAFAVDPVTVDVHLRGPRDAVDLAARRPLRVEVIADSIPDDVPEEGAVVPVRVGGLPEDVTSVPDPDRVRIIPLAPAPDEVFPEPPADPDGEPEGDAGAR